MWSCSALGQDITSRSEFVDAGNGVVEWRIYIENSGQKEICCFVDMEGPRFSFGNRKIVRDSRAVCAFPGRDNYMGLLGVTTQLGPTETFRPGPTDPGFGKTIVTGRIGEAKYKVRDCKPQ